MPHFPRCGRAGHKNDLSRDSADEQPQSHCTRLIKALWIKSVPLKILKFKEGNNVHMPAEVQAFRDNIFPPPPLKAHEHTFGRTQAACSHALSRTFEPWGLRAGLRENKLTGKSTASQSYAQAQKLQTNAQVGYGISIFQSSFRRALPKQRKLCSRSDVFTRCVELNLVAEAMRHMFT